MKTIQTINIKIEDLKKVADDQYVFWAKNVAPKNVEFKNLRSLYNKETGIAKFKQQLKVINYLLSDL